MTPLAQSSLVAAGCLVAGGAALLPLRRAVFITVVVLAAASVVSFGDQPPLATLCVFLVVVVLRGLQEDRRRGHQLLAEMAATHAAQRHVDVLAERARIAREIHDVLAHSLSALLLQLEAVAVLLADDPADRRTRVMVERAAGVAREGLVEAKQAVAALRGELPGIDRVRVLTEQFQELTGVPCRLDLPAEAPRLTADASLALYRIVQEALTNVTRHARAPRAVTVTLSREGTCLQASITDESRPPRVVDHPRGHGLTGLRERAALAGGSLSAGPTPHGFLVVLRLPELTR